MNLKIQNLPRRHGGNSRQVEAAGHHHEEAGKTVKGKKGEASTSPLIRLLMTFVPTSSTPCYCREAIRRTTCAATAVRGYTRDFVNSGKPVLPFATARSC